MKIATIGTSGITESFIQTGKLIQGVSFVSCYSRMIDQAKAFAKKHAFESSYDDLDEMLKKDDFDFVYIASPNAVHYSQALKCLEHHKNVIVEKPIVIETKHLQNLYEIAHSKGLFVFEAMSNIHTPNFKIAQKAIASLGDIKLIQGNYSKYSRQYDAFLEGKNPNIFNPQFAGGALMDLNVYNLHPIVHLFGKPNAVSYYPNIKKGIDTSGILILQYEHFKASLSAAKDSTSDGFLSIQGEKGTMSIQGHTNEFKTLIVNEDVYKENHESRLYHEIEAFNLIYKHKDHEKMLKLLFKSIEASSVLEKARLFSKLKYYDL